MFKKILKWGIGYPLSVVLWSAINLIYLPFKLIADLYKSFFKHPMRKWYDRFPISLITVPIKCICNFVMSTFFVGPLIFLSKAYRHSHGISMENLEKDDSDLMKIVSDLPKNKLGLQSVGQSFSRLIKFFKKGDQIKDCHFSGLKQGSKLTKIGDSCRYSGVIINKHTSLNYSSNKNIHTLEEYTNKTIKQIFPDISLLQLDKVLRDAYKKSEAEYILTIDDLKSKPVKELFSTLSVNDGDIQELLTNSFDAILYDQKYGRVQFVMKTDDPKKFDVLNGIIS